LEHLEEETKVFIAFFGVITYSFKDTVQWKGLTFEEEVYLKKLLIKHSLEKELDAFYGKNLHF
jgi:hypothetical protein